MNAKFTKSSGVGKALSICISTLFRHDGYVVSAAAMDEHLGDGAIEQVGCARQAHDATAGPFSFEQMAQHPTPIMGIFVAFPFSATCLFVIGTAQFSTKTLSCMEPPVVG